MPACQILIIDDDEDDISLLSETLVSCGVEEVHYVFSAMEAFMYLQSIQAKTDLPKLIITDHYLPMIKGTEFMEDLKKMNSYKDIHVIVLSNVGPPEVEKYQQLGVKEVVPKPNTYDEYVALAKKITEKILPESNQ